MAVPVGSSRRNQDPGHLDCSLLDFCLEIREVIRDEAATELAAGRAVETADEEDPALFLEPQNPLAAPLSIYFNSNQLITYSPGRNGMSIEMFSKNEIEIKDNVRSMVRVVLRGKYAEHIKEDASKAKIAAEWEENGERQRAGLNIFRFPRPGSQGWRTVTYEPY
jgi:hypothetical protein